MQLNTNKAISNEELRDYFITEVTNNLNSIRLSTLSKEDYEIGYAVLSFLIDKYKLEKDALELIQFYKDYTKELEQ